MEMEVESSDEGDSTTDEEIDEDDKPEKKQEKKRPMGVAPPPPPPHARAPIMPPSADKAPAPPPPPPSEQPQPPPLPPTPDSVIIKKDYDPKGIAAAAFSSQVTENFPYRPYDVMTLSVCGTETGTGTEIWTNRLYCPSLSLIVQVLVLVPVYSQCVWTILFKCMFYSNVHVNQYFWKCSVQMEAFIQTYF